MSGKSDTFFSQDHGEIWVPEKAIEFRKDLVRQGLVKSSGAWGDRFYQPIGAKLQRTNELAQRAWQNHLHQ